MRRKIPGSRALLALDAAVRHSSFTAAAEELSLTQSAICRHIASLEEHLAVELFRRTRRGVVPTEAGRAYGQKVSRWLDRIERDTLELMSRRGAGGELTLAAIATFAQCWLLPRLPDFSRRHPQITLSFVTRTRPFLFQDTSIAASIFGGEGIWEGTERIFLLSEPLIPVTSPALIGHRKAILPEDFSRHRLLHLDTRPVAWRDWLRRAALPVANDMAGPRFDLYSLIVEAAAQGLGIGLAPRFTVERELELGRLVTTAVQPISNARTSHGRGGEDTTNYYLVYPQHRQADVAFGAFRDWLVQQCAAQPGHDAASNRSAAPH